MKRVGDLIGRIAEMDNLRLAFYNASKSKQAKQEVVAFREHLDENLQKLSSQILSGDVSVGKYHKFKIFDPKERLICAASFDERVLHHAIINVCHPYFERNLIYDTYATRKGKGLYSALERAMYGANHCAYVAKLDVRKYFDSISHAVLSAKLRRIFKDKPLLAIFDKIIGSYEVSSASGLPIGNLTSQYFANFYLSSVDHHLKEVERVPVYVRYMDDMLIFGDNISQLKETVARLSHVVREELKIEFKPPVYRCTDRLIEFCGYKVSRHLILLSCRSKVRLRKKMSFYWRLLEEEGYWGQAEYQRHIIPLTAFARHAYSKKYRMNLIKRQESEGL